MSGQGWVGEWAGMGGRVGRDGWASGQGWVSEWAGMGE